MCKNSCYWEYEYSHFSFSLFLPQALNPTNPTVDVNNQVAVHRMSQLIKAAKKKWYTLNNTTISANEKQKKWPEWVRRLYIEVRKSM